MIIRFVYVYCVCVYTIHILYLGSKIGKALPKYYSLSSEQRELAPFVHPRAEICPFKTLSSDREEENRQKTNATKMQILVALRKSGSAVKMEYPHHSLQGKILLFRHPHALPQQIHAYPRLPRQNKPCCRPYLCKN